MTRTRPGALVISLDFELHWGVRDHVTRGSPYEQQLHGAREAVPATLELFERFDVAGTWATVGFLFARTRQDLEHFRPRLLPTYRNPSLSPYAEPVGEDEAADPLHYAPSLIDRIRSTPRQEVATHTYSHYFCGEAGQTADQFEADLLAARRIAEPRGIHLRSIVFPRNQYNPAYDDILRRHGIVAFRGNPSSWMWRFGDTEESSGRLKRMARFADAYLPLTGDGTIGWNEIVTPGGLANVSASFFVRPYSSKLARLEELRMRRLVTALGNAARRGRIIHLWWHPHNFGVYTGECLRLIRSVLQEFQRCRDHFGMRSMTMAEVATEALELEGSHPEARPTGWGTAALRKSSSASPES